MTIARQALAALMLLCGGPMLHLVQAQEPARQKTVGSGITSFERQLERGWRATHLIGLPVVTRTSTALGRLRNLMLDRGGRIEALVVVGQGRTVSRDLELRVPWSRVQEAALPEQIVVSAAAGQPLGGVFSGAPESARLRDELPVTELIGDPVVLSSGREAGYVTDLVFSAEGNALALLARLRGGANPGVYAFRLTNWMGSWRRERGTFFLPYASADDAQSGAVRIASQPYPASTRD